MPDSAPQKFALFCEENGWDVEREIINAKDEHKRVTATSPNGAVVTAEWIGTAALGPAIGHFTPAGGGDAFPIKNAASARRIVDGSEIPVRKERPPKKDPSSAPKPRKRREPGAEPEPARELTRTVDWDPYKVTEEELLALLPGRSITWQTSYGYETANIPPLDVEVEIMDKKTKKPKVVKRRNPHIFISESQSEETEGERIFNFCDPYVGFRAAFVAAIVQVG